MELFKILGVIEIQAEKAIKQLESVDKKAEGLGKSLLNLKKDSVSAADTMVNKFSKLGKVMIAAFSVKAISSMTKSMVEASASLEAMDSQFVQIFKGAEKEKAMTAINKQSKDMSIHVDRLTKSWSRFGMQTKGVGMDSEQSITATTLATKLAADAAAAYNMSLENATASISSFLKGNFEAGDAIGVTTRASEANIKAIDKYGKKWAEITEAERQFILLDIIDKTYAMTGVAGQAVREMDAWENVTGNLKATWTRFLSVVGAPVLKIAIQVVQGFTKSIEGLQEKMKTTGKDSDSFATFWEDTGKPIFEGLSEVFLSLLDVMKAVLPVVASAMKTFAPFIGPLAEIAIKVMALISVFNIVAGVIAKVQAAMAAFNAISAVVAGPIGWAIAAIVALIAVGKLVVDNWDLIKEKAGQLGDFLGNIFSKIGDAIIAPFKLATEFIKNQVDKIKGFFDGLKIQLPKIKLPKFSIKGKFSLSPPSIPKLGVDWNAKGGYMTRATIFGQAGNSLQGGGEAGGEGIVPLEGKHMLPLADAIAARLPNNNAQPITFNVTAHIREEADIKKVADEFYKLTAQTNRAKGRI